MYKSRHRFSSDGPNGLKSKAASNKRYKGSKEKAEKELRGQSPSRLNRMKRTLSSKLMRSLKKSYTIDLDSNSNLLHVNSSPRGGLRRRTSSCSTVGAFQHTTQCPTPRRVLSSNTAGQSLVGKNRNLTVSGSVPQWMVEKKKRKENFDSVVSASQPSNYEEVDPVSQHSFGRLTRNVVDLKRKLNSEFNKTLTKIVLPKDDRKESDDSDQSFVEVKEELSEMDKSKAVSKLFRQKQDLEMMKTAMFNNFKKKKEEQEKRKKQMEFDEEFLSKKKKRKSAAKRIYSTIKKRVSLGKKKNKEQKRTSRGVGSFSLDLDDDEPEFDRKNMEKLRELIAAKELEEEIRRNFKVNNNDQKLKTKTSLRPARRVSVAIDNGKAAEFKRLVEAKNSQALTSFSSSLGTEGTGRRRMSFRDRKKSGRGTLRERLRQMQVEKLKSIEQAHHDSEPITGFAFGGVRKSSRQRLSEAKKSLVRRRSRMNQFKALETQFKEKPSRDSDTEENSDSDDSLVQTEVAEADSDSDNSLIELVDDDDSLVEMNSRRASEEVDNDSVDSIVFVGNDAEEDSDLDSLVELAEEEPKVFLEHKYSDKVTAPYKSGGKKNATGSRKNRKKKSGAIERRSTLEGEDLSMSRLSQTDQERILLRNNARRLNF